MAELALEINDDIELNNNIIKNINQKVQEDQTNFIQSSLGKAINSALDIGIKAILPDLIEDEVIDIKDCILQNGFKEGLKQVIESAINLGKSAIGLVTGNFEFIRLCY